METVQVEETNSNYSATGKSDESEWYVEVDRKISFFEWFLVLTGPIVMPIIGVFIIVFGIKTINAKNRGDRKEALKCKAMVLGLGQWAYRVTLTFASFALIIYLMMEGNRF
eukprot:sb/3477232/